MGGVWCCVFITFVLYYIISTTTTTYVHTHTYTHTKPKPLYDTCSFFFTHFFPFSLLLFLFLWLFHQTTLPPPNSYIIPSIQCQTLLQYQQFPKDWLYHPQFVFGLTLAMMGAFVNVQSDSILQRLKKKQENKNKKKNDSTMSTTTTTTSTTITTRTKKTGIDLSSSSSLSFSYSYSYYQIPHGGLFEYCSCPHYLGELLEWIGFAIACQGSLVSLSFCFYTAANLIPRAVAQHAWYQTYFDDGHDHDDKQQQQRYPSHRTALIPGVF